MGLLKYCLDVTLCCKPNSLYTLCVPLLPQVFWIRSPPAMFGCSCPLAVWHSNLSHWEELEAEERFYVKVSHQQQDLRVIRSGLRILCVYHDAAFVTPHL